jgi:hypothetical protein
MPWSGCLPILDESPRTFLLDPSRGGTARFGSRPSGDARLCSVSARDQSTSQCLSGWHQMLGRILTNRILNSPKGSLSFRLARAICFNYVCEPCGVIPD